MGDRRTKVVIVGGAGGVGASVAFNLLRMGGGEEVVLVDSRPSMIESHVMDLEQVLEQGASGSVRAGELEELVDADVLVMSPGAPISVNNTRMYYLEANARTIEPSLDLIDRDWQGVLLMVSNPVDPLCTWVRRRTGMDRRRLIGYSLNDTLRLRTGIAKALGAEPGSVEAWVLGEHGDASVPLLDRVAVHGSPIELTPEQAEQAEEFFRNWYVRHVALDSGRSSTWTSGFGVARLVRALRNPEGEIWPASVMLDGEYGVSGVALGVPITVGPGGVQEIHEWELTPEQQAAFQSAAGVVGDATEAIVGSLSV